MRTPTPSFFKPGNAIGEQTSIFRTEPPLPALAIHNEVKTGPEGSGDGACIYGSEFSSSLFVRGTIPAAVNEFSIRGSIPDPAAYVAELLAQELRARGIIIGGKESAQPGKRIAFHTTYSPTVGEIVHWTNQRSINLYAEHLLKKMGEVVFQEGSTGAGIQAVARFWKAQNLDLGGFNMVDGSGLSRKNLATTKQLVGMLLKIKKSDFFPVFFESLPQKEGGIRAKPGSISLVRGYVGYAGNIAFAILVNQCVDRQKMEEKIRLFLSELHRK